MGHVSTEETARGIKSPPSNEALSWSPLSGGDVGSPKGALPLFVLSQADGAATSAQGSSAQGSSRTK